MIWCLFQKLKFNFNFPESFADGEASYVNITLDGCTYPSYKPVHLFFPNFFFVNTHKECFFEVKFFFNLRVGVCLFAVFSKVWFQCWFKPKWIWNVKLGSNKKKLFKFDILL